MEIREARLFVSKLSIDDMDTERDGEFYYWKVFSFDDKEFYSINVFEDQEGEGLWGWTLNVSSEDRTIMHNGNVWSFDEHEALSEAKDKVIDWLGKM